jgi:hypothetical protein
MAALVEALENLGCDVEDTAELIQYQCPVCDMLTERLDHEAAPRRCDHCEQEQPRPLPESGRRSVIRLDLLADRPDLFDAGGISRALKGLWGSSADFHATRFSLGRSASRSTRRWNSQGATGPHRRG